MERFFVKKVDKLANELACLDTSLPISDVVSKGAEDREPSGPEDRRSIESPERFAGRVDKDKTRDEQMLEPWVMGGEQSIIS